MFVSYALGIRLDDLTPGTTATTDGTGFEVTTSGGIIVDALLNSLCKYFHTSGKSEVSVMSGAVPFEGFALYGTVRAKWTSTTGTSSSSWRGVPLQLWSPVSNIDATSPSLFGDVVHSGEDIYEPLRMAIVYSAGQSTRVALALDTYLAKRAEYYAFIGSPTAVADYEGSSEAGSAGIPPTLTHGSTLLSEDHYYRSGDTTYTLWAGGDPTWIPSPGEPQAAFVESFYLLGRNL